MTKPLPIPQISDAEWEVMKIVWDQGPLTAGDVIRELAAVPRGHPARGWRPRTIKTLLSRLVQKGAVALREEENSDAARRFLYRAKVARDQVVREESRSFLARVFNGSVAPALLHFLEDARLTPAEIEQLRQTLQRESAAAEQTKKQRWSED